MWMKVKYVETRWFANCNFLFNHIVVYVEIAASLERNVGKANVVP